MRKFVFLLLLALGFAVCFAAPPPDPVEMSEVPVFCDQVNQLIDLPPVTPCTVLQDQQPAPLLTAIRQNNAEKINCIMVDLPPGIGLPPNIISSNANNNTYLRYTGPVEDNLRPLLTHSSGGMPY